MSYSSLKMFKTLVFGAEWTSHTVGYDRGYLRARGWGGKFCCMHVFKNIFQLKNLRI